MKTKTALWIVPILFLFINGYAQQGPDFGAMAANKADASAVPESYNFSWQYTMEIQSDKGKAMTADYLLQKDAAYFGMRIKQAGDMLMIMDTKNKLSVTTFGKGGQKMAMASKLPDYSEMAAKESAGKKFNYKSLPEKTILGYKCKGVEATDADYVMTFYYTNDAEVNFADLFKSPQAQKMPNAFKDYFKSGEKPLMMAVDINDKAKGKTTTMKCIALEKSTFVFKKSDYKFM